MTDVPSPPPASPLPVSASTLTDDNPWPGLLAFRESDQQYFQGRRVETDALLRLVYRERLTVLFGLSGLGKSSLLQAGLFPRLRAEQVFPVYIRLDYSPAEPDLVGQVWDTVLRQGAAARIEVPDGRPGDTLWARFHRTDADFWNQRNRPVTPLLVFDQFEEIFTLGRRDAATRAAADRLIEALSDLAEGRVPAALKAHLDEHPAEVSQFVFGDHRYKLLFSIREDFLPDLEMLRGRLSGIALNRLRLRGMDGVAALEVVNQAPHLIDPDVAEQVVRFVAADREQRPLADLHVEPALLSVVSRELNVARRHRGEAKITPDLLKGSQDEVLATFYERSVADLPPAARTFIEDSLLTVSGYRDSVALENALSRPGMARAIIDRLVERRLIRIDDRSGAQRVELTHDLLTGVVRASRDTRRQLEAAERERAARVDAQGREQVALRQLRRSRRFTALFLIISVAAVAAAVWAVLSQREAARQRVQAAAAQANAYIQDGVNAMRSARPDHALAHFAAALRADPTSIAARSWITNLLRRAWWVPATPFEHASAVIFAALSPDGQRLLTGAADGEATLWNAADGTRIGEPLRVRLTDPVIAEAVFSPDGRSLTIAWHDAGSTSGVPGSLITSVDATTGAVRGQPIVSTIYADRGAITLDGGRALVATADRAVRVIDVATGAPVGQPLAGHGAPEDAAFSTDGRFVLTNTAANGWRWWDAHSGALLGTVAPWTDRFVGFTADGRFFMWTGSDLHVHDAGTGALQRSVAWPIGRTEGALAVDRTGTRILSVDDSVVRVREFPGAVGARIRRLEAGAEVQAAGFSDDGRWVIAMESVLATESGVKVWDAETGEPVGQTLRHARSIAGVAVTPDGRRIATASVDGTARLWDLTGGGETGVRRRPWERAAALSADGRRAVMVGADNSISVWQTESWTQDGEPLRPQTRIADVALSPDGRWLLSLDEYFDNNNVYDTRFWNLDTRRETAMLPKAIVASPTSDRFSRDGGRVAVSVMPFAVDVFDLATGKSIGRASSSLHAGEQSERLRLSPDGRLLFTGEAHPKGLLWDLQSGTAILPAAAGGTETDVVAFSPDGTRVAAATKEVVQVWNLATGHLVGKPQRNDGEVNYLAFTPDGRTLVAVYGARAQAWDVETGRRSGEPLISESEIKTMAFSPDSKRIVASGDRSVQVWELGSTTPIGTPLMLDTVFNALFTPDGQHVIVLAARTFVTWQVLVAARNDDEVLWLADLAEDVSGFRFNEFGSLVPPFGDDGLGRRALRAWAEANARPGGTDVASFVREFLGERK